MFSVNSLSNKKLHLIYDRDKEHYDVITNLKGSMAKMQIYNGRDTLYNFTHKCDQVCSPVLLHHHVLRIRPGIAVHSEDGSSVRSVFKII